MAPQPLLVTTRLRPSWYSCLSGLQARVTPGNSAETLGSRWYSMVTPAQDLQLFWAQVLPPLLASCGTWASHANAWCLSVLFSSRAWCKGQRRSTEGNTAPGSELLAVLTYQHCSCSEQVGPAGPTYPGWYLKPPSHCHSPASFRHQKAGNWGWELTVQGEGGMEGPQSEPGSHLPPNLLGGVPLLVNLQPPSWEPGGPPRTVMWVGGKACRHLLCARL